MNKTGIIYGINGIIYSAYQRSCYLLKGDSGFKISKWSMLAKIILSAKSSV